MRWFSLEFEKKKEKKKKEIIATDERAQVRVKLNI